MEPRAIARSLRPPPLRLPPSPGSARNLGLMSRRKRTATADACSAKHPTAIGPASTPTVEQNAPLFRPELLFPLLRPKAAGARAEVSLRKRNAAGAVQVGWEAGLGAEERDADAEEMLFNEGMWRWGVALVVCSVLCFTVGFWSIAVGPFVETEGVFVRASAASLRRCG